jgi:isoleucyl-tRNA synthetase
LGIVSLPYGDFLTDLQGELHDYVVEELNVRQLDVCADPMQYATVKAEPNFAVLGKRLGKAMGLVAKAVKDMSQEDVLIFQQTGSFSMGQYTLGAEDITVKHEFRVPEGFTKEDIDAASGEEDVMVIMELKVDQSLMDAGAAREFVNRVQKLRKSAGLQTSDAVFVYFEPTKGIDEKAYGCLLRMIASEQAYLEDSIGCVPQPVASKPLHAIVVASEACSLSTGASFIATLVCPAVVVDGAAMMVACNGIEELAAAVTAVVVSRDYCNLKSESEAGSGAIIVEVDRSAVQLLAGKELMFD